MAKQLSTQKRRIAAFLLTALALAILAAPFAILAHHFGTIFANAENTLR